MKYIIVVDKQSRTNPTTEKKEITINIDELRKKGDVHDDLIIEDSIAKVVRRVGITEYHVTYLLDKEVIEDIGEVKIPLFEGNNYIYIKDEYNNNMCAEYIIKNDFTDMYVTHLQMSSAIEQTTESIELSVNKKLTGYSTTKEMHSAIDMTADEISSEVNKKLDNYDTSEEVNSKIEQKADSITSTVSATYETKIDASNTYATKTQLNTAKSEIKQTTDSISAEVLKKVNESTITGAYLILKINGDTSEAKLSADKIELTANDILNLIAGNTINLTSKNTTITSDNFNVDTEGNMTCSNATISGGKINLKTSRSAGHNVFTVSYDDGTSSYIGPLGARIGEGNGYDGVYIQGGKESMIIVQTLTQTSLKSKKKNIKKLKVNAIELIKKSDICLYNLKGEKAKSKKHIGLVIGDGYNCPDEVISKNGQGVEQYSMTSLAWKAIQEQQEIIENLTKRIEKLEAK